MPTYTKLVSRREKSNGLIVPEGELGVRVELDRSLVSWKLKRRALSWGPSQPMTTAVKIKTEEVLASLRADSVRLQDSEAARRDAARITDDIAHFLDILPPGNGKYVLLQDIHSLRAKGYPAETVIAFCGETGAGKSSLINALLGENVVRTSGMAACTTVITEIRYNARKTIEADIEYLTTEEWKSELEHLLRDLRDTRDGRVKRRSDLTEEAAVAWDKIYAVYPAINEDMLSDMSAGRLLSQNSAVTLMLNNTAHIVVEESERQKFAGELCRYLDPQDDPSTGSYWPLIRKINVRCPSPVLSTGAVLVDLPGTADSNAARCKIAQDYLICASRFFVVSPITRAVSSKVARDLCGEAFRTQLKLDGKYSPHAITFIVTKCDDLSPHEVASEPALRPVLAKCDELKEIDNQIRALQIRLDAHEHQHRGAVEMDGQRQTKKRKLDVYDSGFLGAEKSQRASSPVDDTVQPTQGQVVSDKELSDLDLENVCDRAGSGLHVIRASLERCKIKRHGLLAKCRSNWSKKTLQKDFKDSLDKSGEDSDSGEEWDSDSGNDDTDDDDRELPVFTCSARDYMRINKKTPDGDSGPACFFDEEDTEIPALSRWISELTIPAREQASLDLFVEAKNILASVSAFIEGTPRVTPEDRNVLCVKWKSNEMQLALPSKSRRTARELRAAHYGVRPSSIVSRLIKSFEGVSDAVCRDLNCSVTSGLEQMCRDHAKLAAGAVLGISDDFASGMHWRTYGATLRRHGLFKRDLNTELTVAFTQRIANSWSHMIRVRLASSFKLKQRAMAPITALLDELTASVPDYLESCAKALRTSAMGIARSLLRGVREAILRAWEEDLKRITRILVPFVQLHLHEGYEQAAGAMMKKGVAALQKKIFRDHLNVKKDTMFGEAALALRQHLVAAIQKVRDTLDDHLEKVAKKVEIHMAVLWECPVDSEDNVKARIAALATLREHKAEVERWIQAPRHGNSG